MRTLKYIILFILLFNLAYSHKGPHRKKWKHKKRNHVKVIHKKPKLNITLGYKYNWPLWRWRYDNCSHKDVIVYKESNNINDNVDEIISQIEKLAILKEKGIINEKEYEKKKKELLKRI